IGRVAERPRATPSAASRRGRKTTRLTSQDRRPLFPSRHRPAQRGPWSWLHNPATAEAVSRTPQKTAPCHRQIPCNPPRSTESCRKGDAGQACWSAQPILPWPAPPSSPSRPTPLAENFHLCPKRSRCAPAAPNDLLATVVPFRIEARPRTGRTSRIAFGSNSFSPPIPRLQHSRREGSDQCQTASVASREPLFSQGSPRAAET